MRTLEELQHARLAPGAAAALALGRHDAAALYRRGRHVHAHARVRAIQELLRRQQNWPLMAKLLRFVAPAPHCLDDTLFPG